MAKIELDAYKVKYQDSFFFDTNIWLLLFGTVANYQKKEQKKYSTFFENILERKGSIYITSLVLSEFSNVILRRDFKQWQTNNKLFGQDFKKDFVGIQEYESSVKTITNLIAKILRIPGIIKVGDSFHTMDFELILKDFDKMDFNDCYYSEFCRQYNYKMLSNDRDMLYVIDKIDLITIQ